jgi:hypothetical protein
MQMFRLKARDLQRQFQQEGGRRFRLVACWWLWLLPHVRLAPGRGFQRRVTADMRPLYICSRPLSSEVGGILPRLKDGATCRLLCVNNKIEFDEGEDEMVD